MKLDSVYQKILEEIDNTRVFKNEPMSKHTSFRVGGNADIFVKISNADEIKFLMDISKKEKIPLITIGNGTNLLVKDEGIRGIIAKIDIQDLDIIQEKNSIIITAGAGVSLARVSKIAKDNFATGLEFACGIPGTIGGAIFMNAGAYGSEMKNIVLETTYIDNNGKITTISNEEHKFEYRNSVFSKNNGIILQTKLQLEYGNKEEIQKIMDDNNKSRIEKQPVDKPSAGSTFKRGNGFITAKLIDECGLKGYKIGGAMVSTKHAGFIINEDNATAKDILKLIEHVQKEIKQKFNVDIELEVRVIGE